MRKPQTNNKRLYVFGVFLLLVSSLVTYRLFTLTFIQHEAFAKAAQNQQTVPATRLAGRGNIYTYDQVLREQRLAATNQKTASEIKRVYPMGMLASHVLGFVGYSGYDRIGQYGVEGAYDELLSGLQRTQKASGNTTYSRVTQFFGLFKKDAEDMPVFPGVGASGGEDIVLTIDPTIQSYVETRLDALLDRWDSPHGTIIVQDPATGAILAMASSPSFDPNAYRNFDLSDFPNPATQEVFEPGSSFKVFTMSAALNSGAVAPDTTYEDTGEVKIGTYTIRNFNEKANGLQTMRQVLEHSLNTGTIFAQRKTGDDAFLNYIVAFGFGQKTGIDLKGELPGNIGNLYEGRAINFATASFGQGIAVTPLQLINGYSAIANGGRLMKPYVVKEVLHADGTRTATKPTVLGAPITDRTATQMKTILTGVVDRGFDKARIKGYDVAGETGTAQIPNKDGGYLENKQFIHDFVGFAPSYDPKFVVLIKMDKPKGITFAADSLSPVFGDIAQFLIRYMKIAPTRS